MSKKSEFIEYVNALIRNQEEPIEMSDNVRTYWEALIGGNGADDKPMFTDNGKLIMSYLQSLPDRLNIVITSKERSLGEMTAFIPLEEAYSRATHTIPEDEWFVIGGGSIYKEFLPICDKVYLTKIMVSHENVDTYFPNIELMDNWKCIEQSEIKQYNDISYQFKTYSRIS